MLISNLEVFLYLEKYFENFVFYVVYKYYGDFFVNFKVFDFVV